MLAFWDSKPCETRCSPICESAFQNGIFGAISYILYSIWNERRCFTAFNRIRANTRSVAKYKTTWVLTRGESSIGLRIRILNLFIGFLAKNKQQSAVNSLQSFAAISAVTYRQRYRPRPYTTAPMIDQLLHQCHHYYLIRLNYDANFHFHFHHTWSREIYTFFNFKM